MKIATLNVPVKHERKPEFDEQRFDALENAFDELIAETEAELMAQYVFSNLSVLKFIAPVIDLLMADNLILIVEETRVLTVDSTGMNRQEITRALIMAVKGCAGKG